MTPSQNATGVANCGVNYEKLYSLIRKRVKLAKLTRRLVNPDEVANEVFLRLVDRELPAFGTEEFDNLLRRTTGHVVRDLKLFSKPLADVDELLEEEHPFYEMDFFSVEVEFETVFEKFCESQAEPKRTIFKHSRLIGKRDIGALLGISRNEVARIIKAMPETFQEYITKNRDSI